MEKNEVKKLLTFLSIIILTFSSTKALEPTRVAVVETSGVGPFAISVTLNDYSGGSATNVVGPIAIGNLSPNSSGVISFIVDGAGWSGVPATSVNSHYILDVSVNATLKAQYRLDELTMLQAQTGTGVAQTNAGRNKKVVSMDGQFMSGFGLRLPEAVNELNKKIKPIGS